MLLMPTPMAKLLHKLDPPQEYKTYCFIYRESPGGDMGHSDVVMNNVLAMIVPANYSSNACHRENAFDD